MWNNDGFDYGMGAMNDGVWHGMMGFHGILSLIFLFLIIAGLVLLVRDLRRHSLDNTAASRGNNAGPDHHA